MVVVGEQRRRLIFDVPSQQRVRFPEIKVFFFCTTATTAADMAAWREMIPRKVLTLIKIKHGSI